MLYAFCPHIGSGHWRISVDTETKRSFATPRYDWSISAAQPSMTSTTQIWSAHAIIAPPKSSLAAVGVSLATCGLSAASSSNSVRETLSSKHMITSSTWLWWNPSAVKSDWKWFEQQIKHRSRNYLPEITNSIIRITIPRSSPRSTSRQWSHSMYLPSALFRRPLTIA